MRWPSIYSAPRDGTKIVLVQHLTIGTEKAAPLQKTGYGFWCVTEKRWVGPVSKPDCWRHLNEQERKLLNAKS